MLLGHGFSIQYVSKRLGHANIEITWRVYSHLLDEMKSQEDEMLDSKLSFSKTDNKSTTKCLKPLI